MLKNGKSALAEFSDPHSTEQTVDHSSQSASARAGYKVTEKLNHALTEIRSCREEIRRLAARLVMVREEERKRIAAEIHDELGQAIAVGMVQLSFLKGAAQNQPKILEELSSVSELFASLSESARRISNNLSPLVLEEAGLEAAMKSFLADYAKRTGICCRLHMEEKCLPYSVEASFTIFRIFQEALANVVRHAGASQVQVNLSLCSRGLVLEIVDNGKGLQPAGCPVEGRGLMGIRERVMACGGQMSLSSLAGAGTSLLVLIPVESNAA
jgi:signal transduction histidine kinase